MLQDDMVDYASEMRLFDPNTGERLYLDAEEREKFIKAAQALPDHRHTLLCEVLHWTGCRLSEALELTPRRIEPGKGVIRFRTLKKRKRTHKGELKAPVFRNVPIPSELDRLLQVEFKIRKARESKNRIDLPLWAHRDDSERPMHRSTGWRIIKRVMDVAGIAGPQATAKGFRHGYAVAMIIGGMDYRLLRKYLGHERPETTAIYLQVVGQEEQRLTRQYWETANADWQPT